MKQNKLLRVFTSITGVIILSKLLGFVRQMITASVFGATIETDVISLSEGLIGNIKYVLVQTLLTSFVAIYLHIREEDPRNARRFGVDVGKAFSLVAMVIIGVVLIFAQQIAKLIAPSYSAEHTAQLATYLRIYAPVLILFVWMSVFHALLNANQRFIPGELEGMNQSIILIIFILALQSFLGVQVLVAAFWAYVIWNTVFLGFLSKPYWEKSSGNPFRNPAIKRLLRMTTPLLLGYSMVYINQQVDKILVSGEAAGTVTALGYAAVLSNLVSTLIASFCSILFTYITMHISKNDDEVAANMVTRSATMLMMIFLPISILTIICSEDIVSIAFGRGAFTSESVSIAASALCGYALMFVPLVLRELFSRFQYGYQNSKIPMINSTIGIVFNIVLSIVLCPRFGVFGVTFASSVSVLICGALNTFSSKRNNAYLSMKPLLRCLPWLCVGGTACVAAAMWSLHIVTMDSALLRFAVATLCGGGAYLIIVSPYIYRIIKKRT